MSSVGEVYMVGAGPGDPDLLTLRPLRLMQKADVVLYDNLVSKSIVEMTRAMRKRIFVGKKRAITRCDRSRLTSCWSGWRRKANAFSSKGGDPFIFGAAEKRLKRWRHRAFRFRSCPHYGGLWGGLYAGIR